MSHAYEPRGGRTRYEAQTTTRCESPRLLLGVLQVCCRCAAGVLQACCRCAAGLLQACCRRALCAMSPSPCVCGRVCCMRRP